MNTVLWISPIYVFRWSRHQNGTSYFTGVFSRFLRYRWFYTVIMNIIRLSSSEKVDIILLYFSYIFFCCMMKLAFRKKYSGQVITQSSDVTFSNNISRGKAVSKNRFQNLIDRLINRSFIGAFFMVQATSKISTTALYRIFQTFCTQTVLSKNYFSFR